MPAIVIVEINIEDHTQYEEYKKLTPATIEAYGGRFMVRGAATLSLEGDWNPERLVVLEFPDQDTAIAWWKSEEYSLAKSIRNQAAKTKMLVVETLSLP
jgi:uncharacterized protein (DUF1330 family)